MDAIALIVSLSRSPLMIWNRRQDTTKLQLIRLFRIFDDRPATHLIPDSSVKTVADSYFSAGEVVFNVVAGQAVTSQYFKRS